VKIVIVGATGNAGTSVLRSLADEPQVTSIVGIARREPQAAFPKTSFVAADIRNADLVPLFEGANAVIHLAWLIQPSHDLETVRSVNVGGSQRVFRAAADAGVPALVYASSIGAYSAGPKRRAVDESWPTDGIPTSFYSRHKAATERMLDELEAERPEMRIVRLRKALIFKREAASGIRRLFFGPFIATRLLDPDRIPVVPDMERLVFQAVHSYDVGEAYRLAVTQDVRGAFNIAAEPVLDADELARILDARKVRVSRRVAWVLAHVSWLLHLQPTPVGWLDLATGVPMMDTRRAREELGWTPRYTSAEALTDLLEGLRDRAGAETPPLAPETSGRFRWRDIATGVGSRL